VVERKVAATVDEQKEGIDFLRDRDVRVGVMNSHFRFFPVTNHRVAFCTTSGTTKSQSQGHTNGKTTGK
jgi:hypothetical protein